MDKQEFITRLQNGLSGLPKDDIEERLNFYSEMIEDRMEDGLTEEEAIKEVGSVDEIVAQVISEVPLSKIAKERVKPKRKLETWEIILIIISSLIWFPLLVSVIAVIFSIYVTVWSVAITLWAVFVSLAGSSLGSMVAGIVFVCKGSTLSGIAMLAGGIICAGLSIFMFFGCKAATKGVFILTKKILVWIKNCFIKKEEV